MQILILDMLLLTNYKQMYVGLRIILYLNIVVEKLGVKIDKLSLSKITRILDIYRKLNNGHLIIKVVEAKRYVVNERSIQR